VEDAVHDGLGQVLGVLGADHDVAQLARAGGGARLVDRERQHVGGRVEPAMLAVQLLDPRRRDELDREMAVLDSRGGERRERGAPELLRDLDELYLDQVR
jgi:hypothetical protein